MKAEDFNTIKSYEEEEGYVVDIQYVQAPSLKELRTLVLKKLDKGFELIDQNPFTDHSQKDESGNGIVLWTQVMVQYEYGEEEEFK